MALRIFATGLAALIALQAPLPALAQDDSEEEQPINETEEPVDDTATDDTTTDDTAADDTAADDTAADDTAADDTATDDTAADDPATDDPAADDTSTDDPATDEAAVDEFDLADGAAADADPANQELLANAVFEANVEDILVADDQFSDDEFEDPADDTVAVETGNDGVPDVFELYDEDGIPPSDEDEYSEASNPGAQAGLFFEKLPLLRKPTARTARLQTPGLPAAALAAGMASPRSPDLKAAPGYPARGRLAELFARRHAEPASLGPARGSAAFPLKLMGGVSGAFSLTRGASSVYLVRDGGAPFQAQVNYATSPRTWKPTAKYAEYAKYPDWEARHICGGTLIEPEWVLTAAHCLWSAPDSRAEKKLARGVNVLLGAENLARPKSGMTYKVDRVVIHGDFRPGNIYRHDIALLHIVSGGRASRVNQISSVRRHTGAEPADRSKVSVTGWGKTLELESQLASTALWRADVKLISVTRCRALPNLGQITLTGSRQAIERIGDGSLCAGESRGKACSGDSGGPLVFTNVGPPRLVGVTSWTRKESCGKPDIPNVYTRVSAYESWIERAMQTAAKPESVTYVK